MKKTSDIIFWVIVIGIALVAMFTFYNKYKSNAEISQKPEINSEQTVKNPDAGTSQKSEEKNEQTAENSDTKGPVVPELELKDMEGNTVKLSDYKGKVVVLNFWATWCKYCIKEMPDFEELSKEFEKAGDAVVLAVNVQEKADTVKDYLEGADLSALKVLLDESGEVAASYGVNGYPNTYIIDKDGTLYKYIPGMTNKEIVRNMVDEIR